VATGDYWLATQAKERGLVDEIMTSDEYLSSKMKDFDVIEIKTIDHRHRLEQFFQRNMDVLKGWLQVYFTDERSPVNDAHTLYR
jgi:ClpP class serine protease